MAELRVILFVRSTRNLRPTVDGLVFLEQCEHGLALVNGAREHLAAGHDAIRGCI